MLKILLVTYISLISYISFIPQIVKLYKEKDSTGVSLLSWTLWLSTALARLGVALILFDYGLIFISLTDILFTAITVILILKYNKKD